MVQKTEITQKTKGDKKNKKNNTENGSEDQNYSRTAITGKNGSED